jgi:hypothetical protein
MLTNANPSDGSKCHHSGKFTTIYDFKPIELDTFIMLIVSSSMMLGSYCLELQSGKFTTIYYSFKPIELEAIIVRDELYRAQ